MEISKENLNNDEIPLLFTFLFHMLFNLFLKPLYLFWNNSIHSYILNKQERVCK